MGQHKEVFEIERTIAADRERVYAMLTRAERLREWFCDQAWTNPCPGGRFSVRWNSGYEAHGAFVEIDPPEEITLIWQGVGELAPTVVEWELDDEEEGTEVTLQHIGFGSGPRWEAAYQEAKKAWTEALDNLQSVLETGIDQRELRRPFLGIMLENMTPERAKEEDIAAESGVYVSGVVEESAAEAANLQPGDVLVGFGGYAVNNAADLAIAMQRARAGDTVDLELLRGQEEIVLSATLRARELPDLSADPTEAQQQIQQRYVELKTALAEACAAVTEEQAATHPEEGEWSVKEVLAHLSATERWLHQHIARTCVGRWEAGGGEWHLFPDMPTLIQELEPTLEALLRRTLHDMEETVQLVAHLPEALPINRRRQILQHVMQYADHTEEHLDQIRNTLQALQSPETE